MKRQEIFDHVPPEWPECPYEECKIAFVGEAPGDEETIQGIPLVGPSGRLFNRALRVAGIDRRDCLTTNVFDFQLPDNKVENICVGAKELKELLGDGHGAYNLPAVSRGKYLRPEYAGQLDRMWSEIKAVKPNLIVALGTTALWALTGQGNIKARRGAIHPGTPKILPTVHPAAIIHGGDELYHLMLMDFQKAARECQFPEVRYPKRRFCLEPTLDDLRAFKRAVEKHAAILSVDIETKPSWRLITSIQMAYRPDFAMVIPFMDERQLDGSYWRMLEEELEARKIVRELLALPIPKLGQNYVYDFVWLLNEGMPTYCYQYDTRLEHYVLFPELPKDLGTLGSVYSSEVAWKTMRPGKTTKREE